MEKASLIIQIRDLQAVNIDKLALLVLATTDWKFHEIEVVIDPEARPHALDLEALTQRYYKKEGRSLTETYALEHGLGTVGPDGTIASSSITGLVGLCYAFAMNHGKVNGIQGGGLYTPNTIPNAARNLPLLSQEAPTVVIMALKAIAYILSLESKNGVAIEFSTLAAAPEWVGVLSRLRSAEQRVAHDASRIADALAAGRSIEAADLFDLKQAKEGEKGLVLRTIDPNLMKHLWAALAKAHLRVAVALVGNTDTGRIAVLTSSRFDVDLSRLARHCQESTAASGFDINLEGGRIIWVPGRSEVPGPSLEGLRQLAADNVGFRTRSVRAPQAGDGLKASIADRHRSQGRNDAPAKPR